MQRDRATESEQREKGWLRCSRAGRRRLPLLKTLDLSGALCCWLKSLAAAVLHFPETETCDIPTVPFIPRDDGERQSAGHSEELQWLRGRYMQGCNEALASNELFHHRGIF